MLIIGNNFFYVSRNIRNLDTGCVETHFSAPFATCIGVSLREGEKLNLVIRFALILLVVLFTW
jgi:hypothetical protein